MDVELSDCFKNCEGLLITSYIKKENEPVMDEIAENIIEEYTKYKKYVQFPTSIKGILVRN